MADEHAGAGIPQGLGKGKVAMKRPAASIDSVTHSPPVELKAKKANNVAFTVSSATMHGCTMLHGVLRTKLMSSCSTLTKPLRFHLTCRRDRSWPSQTSSNLKWQQLLKQPCRKQLLRTITHHQMSSWLCSRVSPRVKFPWNTSKLFHTLDLHQTRPSITDQFSECYLGRGNACFVPTSRLSHAMMCAPDE